MKGNITDKNISFMFYEDPFSKGAQGLAFLLQKLKKLMNILQTKPHGKKLV